MSDPRSVSADDAGDTDARTGAPATEDRSTEAPSTEELRRQVEERYDFDSFGPEEMAEMSANEWEAAFDPDSWITGPTLLDRVEADLKSRIARRDVFAVLERPREDTLLVYSDTEYALVDETGSVEGRGTVLRDVKPSVALCSMEEYDVPEPPEGEVLPRPTEVPEGGGERGNHMLQFVAVAQLIAGVALLVGWIGFGASVVALVAGLAFLVIALLLFVVVANARLSDRFRASEFRDRLRAAGVESGERPEFVPSLGEREASPNDPDPADDAEPPNGSESSA